MRTTITTAPDKPIKMTEADRRFLASLPVADDWTCLNGLSQFRIRRLLMAGALQQRVDDPSLTASQSMYAVTYYRRAPLDAEKHQANQKETC